MKWRIIKEDKKNYAYNMAVDEAILIGVINGTSLPTIRFYDWEPPTASCGYNQTASNEVDFNVLKKKGYGFVRRPTGGRLVLHKNEVTYSVIAPLEDFLSGNVTHTYSMISLALANGLKKMGIDVSLEKGTLSTAHQRASANPCFTSASRYELSYNKKKIVGSAQVRRDNCFLQHGSILLDQNQKEVAELLPGFDDDKRKRIMKYLDIKTVAINQILKNKIDFYTAVNYLILGFVDEWKIKNFITDGKLSDDELKSVTYLISEKYNNDSWNFKK